MKDKYIPGDLVAIIKPAKMTSACAWLPAMDRYIGKQVVIKSIFSTDQGNGKANYGLAGADRYTWNEDWLVGLPKDWDE